MRAQVDITLKTKTKKIINQKNKKKPYANRTQDYEMIIQDNKEDLRQENYRLPQID